MYKEQILKALQEVCHPGRQNRSIVELGMVSDIREEQDAVVITLAFPKRRDPLTEYLVGATRACLIISHSSNRK